MAKKTTQADGSAAAGTTQQRPGKSSTKNSTKNSEKNSAKETSPTRSPQVRAAECPKNPAHPHTAVYRTRGRTRYCRCDDCGATWKQSGPFADPLRNYIEDLIADLEATPAVELPEGGHGIIIPTNERDKLVAKLREQLTAG